MTAASTVLLLLWVLSIYDTAAALRMIIQTTNLRQLLQLSAKRKPATDQWADDAEEVIEFGSSSNDFPDTPPAQKYKYEEAPEEVDRNAGKKKNAFSDFARSVYDTVFFYGLETPHIRHDSIERNPRVTKKGFRDFKRRAKRSVVGYNPFLTESEQLAMYIGEAYERDDDIEEPIPARSSSRIDDNNNKQQQQSTRVPQAATQQSMNGEGIEKVGDRKEGYDVDSTYEASSARMKQKRTIDARGIDEKIDRASAVAYASPSNEKLPYDPTDYDSLAKYAFRLKRFIRSQQEKLKLIDVTIAGLRADGERMNQEELLALQDQRDEIIYSEQQAKVELVTVEALAAELS